MSGKKYIEREIILEKIRPYLPLGAADLVVNWLEQHRVFLKITRERKTKLGDFRPGRDGKAHRISINGSLNPFSFFLTLVHEIAHLTTWNTHGPKALAHGKEWKRDYAFLLTKVVDFFPPELRPVIYSHIEKPGAASCSDPSLLVALSAFDPLDGQSFLSEISEGALFRLGKGRVFKKGPLRRTRFRCQDQQNKKYYLVSGVSRVTPLEEGRGKTER